MGNTIAPEATLYEIVAGGLYRMFARRLQYAPSVDDLGQCAGIMADDLVAAGITDKRVIAAAMDSWGRSHTDWPSPRNIIDVVRKVQQDDAFHAPQLSPPPFSYEKADRARKLAMQIIRSGLRASKQSSEFNAHVIERRRHEWRNSVEGSYEVWQASLRSAAPSDHPNGKD